MSENSQVVNEEVTTPQASEATTPQDAAKEEAAQAAPGSKTDSELLLQSLKEEREKRREMESKQKELEEKIETLTTSNSSEEVFSDEGRVLQNQVSELKSALAGVTGELAKKDVLISNPVLGDKWEAFEAFREDPENKGMNMKTAAKAFLIENGLTETTRKGLETSTGGDRTPVSSGMTTDDVKHLRETNYKKYVDMLDKGLITFK